MNFFTNTLEIMNYQRDANIVVDYDISILNGNDFEITQNYGDNPGYYAKFRLPFHIGIDFVSLSRQDWEIESVMSGVVRFAGFVKDYGNVVIVQHDDNMLAKYMHLDKIYVKTGDRVEQLQPIGIIGNTGNSYGRHCHLEVSIYDGNIWSVRGHVDPIIYLNILDEKIKLNKENMLKQQLIDAINRARFITQQQKNDLLYAINTNNYNDVFAIVRWHEEIIDYKNTTVADLSNQLTNCQNRIQVGPLEPRISYAPEMTPINSDTDTLANQNVIVTQNSTLTPETSNKQVNTPNFQFSWNKQYDTFVKSGVWKYLVIGLVSVSRNYMTKAGVVVPEEFYLTVFGLFGISGGIDSLKYIAKK